MQPSEVNAQVISFRNWISHERCQKVGRTLRSTAARRILPAILVYDGEPDLFTCRRCEDPEISLNYVATGRLPRCVKTRR
jgi:hypothetical protein